MIPAVIQGWGNQMYFVRGGQVEIGGKSLYIDRGSLTSFDPAGQVDRELTSLGDFNHSMFGGHNSWFAAAYANHKPMAFLGNFRLISTPNYAIDNKRFLYVVGFDGSGIFFNKGGKFESRRYRAGPGFELFNPSGSPISLASHDLAVINHNDHVFMIGAHTENAGNDGWTNGDFGWTYDDSGDGLLTGNANDNRRTYRVASINRKTDKRIMGPAQFAIGDVTGTCDNQFHLQSCDLIAFGDDLYYANWIDVLRFPGASGRPVLIQNTNSAPRAKSFELFPTSGYNNGSSVGPKQLFMLQSDAQLRRVTPSGADLFVDLTAVKLDLTARAADNFARSTSDTLEPGRTPLLMNFNNELHAFVTTATSGYTHLTCPGNPSGIGRWTDRTGDLFADMQRVDGCVYGFADEVTNKMYVLHVSYSAYGHFGMCGGGQGCGGGMWLYQYDVNRVWQEMWRGGIGLPPRGLIPYQQLGPFATAVSGINTQVVKCSDYAILSYDLFDQLARPVNVNVEFTIDEGLTWQTARRFKSYVDGQPLGSGVSNLPTSPDGVSYTFFWDFVNDVGFNTQKDAQLRVRPIIKS